MTRSARLLALLLAITGACTCAPKQELTGSDGVLEIDREKTGVDFNRVRLGDTKRVELTLFNRGRTKLRITKIERVDLPASFRIAQPPADLAADSSGRLAITFSPEEVGKVGGTLVVKTDSQERPEVSIALSGEGVETKIAVTPEVIDFGLVEVDARATATIQLRNDGIIAEDVKLTALAEGSPHFTVGPVPGENNVVHLEPGAIAELPVVFSPRWAEPAGFSSSVDILACPSCSTQTVTLKGGGVEAFLNVSPTECLDFGLVNPGSKLTKQVTIRNVGSRDLNLLEGAISGSAHFTVAGTFPAPVTAGNAVTLDVTYAPLDLNLDTGTLHVATDDPKASSVQFCLKGGGGGPDVTVVPARLDFGPVAVGVPRTKTVRISNAGTGTGTGSAELTITQATIRSGSGGEFTTTFSQPISIDVGSSATLSVRYAPTADGADTDTLVLSTNDADSPSIEIPLAGTGRALPPCQLAISPATSKLAFGNVSRGRTVTLPVALQNQGTADCLVNDLGLDPSTDPAFALVNGPVAQETIPAGGTLGVLVSFKPYTARSYAGKVAFSVSDPTNPSRAVDLTGVSAAGCLLIAPDEVDFGTVGPQCASRERTINIYDTCSTQVKITSIALADQPDQPFQILGQPTLPLTLNGSNSAQLRVRYRPLAIGQHFGSVFVTTDERPEPYNISLTGTAAADAMQHDVYHQEQRPKVDLLFVIDNSGSMGDEQAALATNFAAFMKYANEQQVDYHIAVTTTDMDSGGEKGRFVPLDTSRPRVLTPQTPNVASLFADNVNVGTNGSGTEREFAPVEAAFSQALLSGHNQGFLRDDALLSVIAITDEVEQSSNTVDYYYNLFLNIKGARRSNMFSYNAVCVTDPNDSEYNTRLIEMARRTGGIVTDVETTNWARDLEAIGARAFGYKTRFFLTSTPEDPSQLTVTLDGQPVPAREGTIKNWEYVPLTNSVDFSVISVPEPGSTLDISYKVSCGQ